LEKNKKTGGRGEEGGTQKALAYSILEKQAVYKKKNCSRRGWGKRREKAWKEGSRGTRNRRHHGGGS